MGIKHFQKWIRENHENAISEINENNNKIDYIYFDLNFCLHNCIYNTKTEETLLKKLTSMIDNIIKKFDVNNVILVADGSAPLAKLILQRKRRLMMVRNLEDTKKLNPLALTAGTIFMDNLKDSLNKYIIKLNERNINVICHISNNGESEYKIMEDIKERYENNQDKTFGILSNDADIIVMSCFSPAFKNIRIIYKDTQFSIINIKKLSKNLKNFFSTKDSIIDEKIINRDFSFISLLLGNDYLPKLNFTSLDRLLSSYKLTLKKFNNGLFNEDNTINEDSMCNFMMNITIDMDNVNKGWNKNFKLSKMNVHLYSNYLEGLLWCMDTYIHCKCRRNDYMFLYNNIDENEDAKSLNIFSLGIYYYIKLKNTIKYPFETNYYVPKHINALLLIPVSCIHLIDKKYQKTIENNFPKLYEEEKCKLCLGYHKKMSELNSVRNFIDFDNDVEKNKYLDDINKTSKDYSEHKKTHKDLTKDEIDKIIAIIKEK